MLRDLSFLGVVDLIREIVGDSLAFPVVVKVSVYLVDPRVIFCPLALSSIRSVFGLDAIVGKLSRLLVVFCISAVVAILTEIVVISSDDAFFP